MIASTIKASGLAILFLLLLPFSLLPSSSASASEEPKRVLLLLGEDHGEPFITTLGQSIRSTLNSKAASRIEFYTEHLDRERIADSVYERELVSFWQKKYEGRKVDLIIVCVASAFDLLSRHRAELFPGTPAVFCVLFEQEVSRIKSGPDVTGVWTAPPFRPTLELALRLHPDTRRVMVVNGSGDFERSVLEIAKAELRDFENQVELAYLPDVTLSELQERLASLPKQTIVLDLSFTKDSAGVVLTNPEILSRVAPTSAAPIYGISSTYFGSGIVGGSLISVEELGARAAEIAARILAGESPRTIAPHGIPSVPMFDWRELRRWGIGEKSLPPGSVIRFQAPSFWDLYKWYIIGLIVFVIFQSALVARLVMNRVTRKRAEGERVCAQAEAEGIRERLAGIIESAMAGIISLDENQRIVLFNNAAEKMFDCAAAEALGQSIERFIPERFRKAHQDHVRAFGETRVTRRAMGELSIIYGRRADGSEFPIEASISQAKTGGQKLYTVMLRDITTRTQFEQALRESEERFRAMADDAPVFVWMSDTDKLGTYANRQWLEFTGRTRDQELGNGWAEGIHPEDSQNAFDTYVSAFDARQSLRMEYRLKRHDGEYRWVDVTGVPRFTTDGTFVGYIGSAVDITERKQIEETVRKIAEGVSASTSEEFLRSLARHLSEVLGVDSVFIGRVAGENHDRVKTVIAFMDGEIRENIEYDLWNTPCEKVIKFGILSCASGVQSRFPLDQQLVEMGVESYLGMALSGATGQPFGLISVMGRLPLKNIEMAEALLRIFASRTAAEMERQQAEESLRQTQSQLAHIDRVLITGELASAIAHEVNQPLTAMVANANAARRMLGDGEPDLDQAREAIDDIVKDAHRASEVVGRIRSLLRKGSHRTESLGINEVIEEVVVIVRNDLVRNKVSLIMRMASDLPEVEADRVEMQQVMLNLIMNAVEAMSSVEGGGRNLLMSTARDESGGVLIEVRDTGVGIASENLERIFDAFYSTRPEEGMGMGLSICRTIVEAHGGRLWAESNEDRGATLRFTLPASIERAS